jgi:hypothetical protein
MGKWLKLSLLVFTLITIPTLAVNDIENANLNSIIIVELQTGSPESATNEFVELFNSSDNLIDATDLKLQYRSASGSDWLTRASLIGELQPRGRYLISSSGYLEDADVFGSLSMAQAGGHLRVIDSNDSNLVYDEMAWGSAQFALTAPAQSPQAGQSLKRLIDEDGRFIDTDNDFEDFKLSDTPSPQTSIAVQYETSENPQDESSLGNTENETVANNNSQVQAQDQIGDSHISIGPFAQLEITELFIDPEKPLLDAEDEFVELYNPNPEPIDLEGYLIQTGSKYSYDFELPNISLGSKQYLAVYSIDTGLTLSNSGGGARLLNPAGDVIFEVDAYPKAKPNLSWALIGNNWQWTSIPTPSKANASESSTSGLSNASDLSGSSKYATLGSAQETNTSSDGRLIYEEPISSNEEVDTAVVAGVGSMALLYAGYEYRFDVQNRIHQFRRYIQSRRGSRKES